MASKKENESILEENVMNPEEVSKLPEEKNIYKDEEYNVIIPLTEEKQDDLTVVINGEVTKIKRGEPVKVSKAVYEVIQNSERMDNLALRRRMALQNND